MTSPESELIVIEKVVFGNMVSDLFQNYGFENFVNRVENGDWSVRVWKFRILTGFGYGNDLGYFPCGGDVPMLENRIIKIGEGGQWLEVRRAKLGI